ncbi:MAG: hypothetical protein GX791_02745, partial [Synergistaceae bacterium]|nr:hypothetical protein [Synergistaceae bacterium]
MKKTALFPGEGTISFRGCSSELFGLSAIAPALYSALTAPSGDIPDTVFLAAKSTAEAATLLKEALDEKIPWVVLGRGWPRRPSAALLSEAQRRGVRLIGPRSEGLLTPTLSGGRGNTVFLAEGGSLFLRTMAMAKSRNVSFLYALSFGAVWDYSPLDAAKEILARDNRASLFIFLLEKLEKGRELLDFAAHAVREGKRVALLPLTRAGVDERLEEAAYRQYGISLLSEPGEIVDSAVAFSLSLRPREKKLFFLSSDRERCALLRQRILDAGLQEAKEKEGGIALAFLEDHTLSPRYSDAKSSEEKRGNILFTSLEDSPALEKKAADLSLPFIPGVGRTLAALKLAALPRDELLKWERERVDVSKCPLPADPTEYDAKIFLGRYGIPIAKERLCRSLPEAEAAAEAIGYPVAMKVMSPSILHKSEARVIALNLQDEEEVRNAYGRTLEKARLADSKARIQGVLIQEMIRGGTEWRIELRRDRRFGPVVEMGIAGVYREILPDGVL